MEFCSFQLNWRCLSCYIRGGNIRRDAPMSFNFNKPKVNDNGSRWMNVLMVARSSDGGAIRNGYFHRVTRLVYDNQR